jgi:hypothetical protein
MKFLSSSEQFLKNLAIQLTVEFEDGNRDAPWRLCLRNRNIHAAPPMR